jgi:hypothetical protein
LTPITADTDPEISSQLVVQAPGMNIESLDAAGPGSAVVVVPRDALPGLYSVTVSGEHAFSTRRYLKVE